VTAPIGPADRDRRRATHDRRRSLHDRRYFWPRLVASGPVGAIVRWFTGPWSSANGLSWMRLLILFLIVRWGLLTVYSIPSESMEPVLHGDPNFVTRDRIAVNKLAFGPRYPFTENRIVSTGKPKRWDIVVFNSPAPSEEGDVLIKRVVGLPGERVRIASGGIIIDGKRAEPPPEIAKFLNYVGEHDTSPETLARLMLGFAKSKRIPVDLPKEPAETYRQLVNELDDLHAELADQDLDKIPRVLATRYVQTISEPGREIIRRWWSEKRQAAIPIQYGVQLTAAEYSVVPEGHYFCLGDNGPESFDSRMFGWVPEQNLIGRAFAIVTPPGRMKDLSGFSQTPRGRLILFGSILVLVLWEIVPGFIVFSTKLRGPIPVVGLRKGEHVLIDRLTYGLRIPFLQRRLLWWRRPRTGDIVCYRMSRSLAQDLYIGVVRESVPGRNITVIATGPQTESGAEPALYTLHAFDIVGIARAVWLPSRRRRRIRTAGS